MITLKDLNDIAENKIKNEAQKAIIQSSFRKQSFTLVH